jgi:hypothetical protein
VTGIGASLVPPVPGDDQPPDRGLKFRIAMWTTIVVLTAGIVVFARFILHLVWP